ncbi:MAG TPA: tetratricopeptide repeat protein [Pyrinomonadaceae bacterium]|nr:tetratricopeptide repeat protein [Pyrinomonadaceae bacterium]
MFRRSAAATLLALLAFVGGLTPSSASAQGLSDVVLIIPFENTSANREANWVGESFADQLSELLGAHGLRVVSPDARELAYARLRLPLTVIPSRATSIKLAQEAGATMVVVGNYEVSPRDEKTIAEVRGSARIIRVNEGRIAGKQIEGNRWATHEFFFGDALTNLQAVQGKLAYQILYEQDDKLPFSQNLIVEQATKVPPKAFEAYVKGAMLPNNSPDKPAYLQNAMREYEKANPGSVYKQAAFELGQLFYAQGDGKKAAEHFSLLQPTDAHYAEAAFYAALAYERAGELQSALDVLLPLSTRAPLTSIYNNAGAISTKAAIAEKSAPKREALLKQAANFLSRAVESAPAESAEGPTVRYNYAYALALSGKFPEAAEQLRAVVRENPRHAEALFLLAKMLEKTGQAEAAAANDNEARKLLASYGRAQTEWEKSQTVSLLSVHLSGSFNRADYVASQRPTVTDAPGATAQDLLAKARELYTAGHDDEALMELRNVVRVEPMNAEAYLLTGRIYMRRGELAPAISQLKASIFWDTEHKLIDAHILLGRIFLERGDRAQATAYMQSAVQIDPNNPEAIALQRELQVGIK